MSITEQFHSMLHMREKNVLENTDVEGLLLNIFILMIAIIIMGK